MNDQTTKLITDLAAKLGTTADHLWGVLIRQAPISAAVNAVVLLVLLTVCTVLWVLSARRLTNPKKVDEAPTLILTVMAACMSFCLAVMSFVVVDGVASGFFNPEYWALKEVLGSIR